LSWERLTALSEAHRRREAETILLLMTAAQGDSKSWSAQRNLLLKVINPETKK
jgi:hypothetical protein